MPDSSSIQRMFAGIAGCYDLMNHVLSLGLDAYWWRRMAQRSGAAEGLFFLDVAAGTGDSSVALARRGARVVSTDFTLAMLSKGPEKFQRKGVQAIAYSVAADAMALPFQDDCFDGVTICYGIRNVADRALAWREFFRVLKPGGTLTVLEFSRPVHHWFRALYDLYSKQVLPRLGAWLAGDEKAYEYLRQSIAQFPSPAIIQEEIQFAGFRHVSHEALTGGIVVVYGARK